MMSRCVYLIQNLTPVILLFTGIVAAFKFPQKLGVRSLVGFYAARFVFIVASMHYLGLGSADLDGWWMHAKWMADGGCFPGKDFSSPYHLGFNLLLFASVKLWHSPYSIVLVFTLAELIAVVVMFEALKNIIPIVKLKSAIILFLMSPIGFASALATQDESLLLLGVAALLLVAITESWKWVGFLVAFVGVLISKIFAPFFLLPVALLRSWTGAFVVVCAVVVYWILACLVGINPFEIKFARDIGINNIGNFDDIMAFSTFGNIWKPLSINPCFAVKTFAATMIGVSCLVFLRRDEMHDIRKYDKIESMLGMITLMMFAFITFYPMTFFTYVVPSLPFMYLMLLLKEKNIMLGVSLFMFTSWQILLRYDPSASSFVRAHEQLVELIYFGCLSYLIVRCLYLYRREILSCMKSWGFYNRD